MKVKQSRFAWIANKSVRQILFIVLFLETSAITLAIWGAMATGHSPKAYFEEGGYMTILSCLQLLFGAYLAKKILAIAKNSLNPCLFKNRRFWQIISIGLVFLAFDDAFKIHEYIDKLLHILLDFKETDISDLADDVIVGGYLLLFLVYVASQWKTIQIFQRSFIYFQVGFILTVVMIIFDAASNNTLFVSMLSDNGDRQVFLQIWFGTFEDSIKIYAEGLFLVGIYKCWQIAKSVNSKK